MPFLSRFESFWIAMRQKTIEFCKRQYQDILRIISFHLHFRAFYRLILIHYCAQRIYILFMS